MKHIFLSFVLISCIFVTIQTQADSAASNQDAETLFKTGMTYLSKKNVPYDSEKGIDYLKRAAALNHIGAKVNLAGFYFDGIIIPKDLEKSASFYLDAAAAGDKLSQGYIGEFYKEGVGVKKDLIQSYIWLNAAKLNCSDGIIDVNTNSLIKEITEMLSPEEIKKASAEIPVSENCPHEKKK